MLEDYPILKDRLTALGVFSGIAIAAVAGFELVITGGFDFLSPGDPIREVAPSAYVQVIDTPWYGDARVVALSSTEYLFAGDDEPRSAEQLAGGYDDRSAPNGAYPIQSDDEIYAQIDALYETESEPADYVESADESWGADYYNASTPAKEDVSAYETASPW